MDAPKEHAALLSLLDRHKVIVCGSCGKEILPALGKLDQTGAPLDAAVYACKSGNCEWVRTVRLFADHASIEPSKDGVTVTVKGEF